ncbi:GIN domain-containing protein [Mucilaginibacter myungsuensis]|uniref:DUF2807 domain-containing protein n=1 Tax=Mucilaginibacter myungsuensis TaxID=649104 RepID=A0A929KWH3_9SPHI|nr:DUF2807 domain-containing protein [Mucilaginibacter myungsuensis]MBE9661735.1 DUF2807 domain-containing protein [Mucilaginibacter myungsuensis]MDN3599833.1 DUF2807 domain-containing protein [Mucilaginibacter myungsuensis]
MKTATYTIALLLSLVTISANSAFATNKDNTVTILAEAKKFNAIEVRGNVEVYLTSGDEDQVKVNANYYGQSALVQNQNGILRISSYTKEALVVYVTAEDLRSLSVYDNAFVKSGKGFSALELDVKLFDNATAKLELNAYNANINVNDRAKMDLAGTVTNCDMQMNQSSTVNSTNFVAERINKKVNNVVIAQVAKNDQELVIL